MIKVIIKVMFIYLFLTINLSFSSESKIALVIGNSDYLRSPLNNPVNDAKAITVTLRKMNFEVIKVENATHAAMKQSISQFLKKIRRGSVGLFYFAGHGVQISGLNYLVPIDNKLDSENEIINNSVNAQDILNTMKLANNEMNIIILDACRDNPFENNKSAGASRGIKLNKLIYNGLAKRYPPKGSILAYSAAPGSIAWDGDGEHGVYTKHLLNTMIQPNLTIEAVFKKVRKKVGEETKNNTPQQITWEETSLTDDFYFVRNNDSLPVSSGSNDKKTIFFHIQENNQNSRFLFDTFQNIFKLEDFKIVNNVKLANYILDVNINVYSSAPVMEGLLLKPRFVDINVAINSVKKQEILYSFSSSGVTPHISESQGKKIAAKKATDKITSSLLNFLSKIP